MDAFLFLFLYRVSSGVQNGLGYAKTKTALCITTIALMAIAGALTAIFFAKADFTWQRVLIMLGGVLSAAGSFGVADSFLEEWRVLPTDIHLWEIFVPLGVTISWIIIGADLITIVCSVYPALILHKAAVNIGSFWHEADGWPGVLKYFWYHGTDDPTGKYFSIPILGIKISRLGLAGRITLAVASLILYAFYLFTGALSGSIYDLISAVLSWLS